MRTYVSLAAVAAVVAGLSVGATNAQAEVYSFFNITNNGNEDLSGQLQVEVTDAGSDQVSFLFTNDVGIDSSITDVYFDDGTLLGIADINESTGVEYTQLATPGDLPGGNNVDPDFETTEGFSADSDAPVSQNGVDSSTEWVEIIFDLINGQTFADTIAALADGSLRIGLHVQAIGLLGGSDSYVNDGGEPPPVPLPAGFILFLSGLAGVGFLGRLKAKRQDTAAV